MRTVQRITARLRSMTQVALECFLIQGCSGRPEYELPSDPVVRHLLGAGGAEPGPSEYRERHRESASEIISLADQVCDHVVDLLGSGPVRVSGAGPGYQRIRWHTDLKSGHSWDPRRTSQLIRIGTRRGADVLFPWELSRMQHLVVLGQAYALSGDPRYAVEYKNQIGDWIDSNRPGRGVNWMSSMESGMRAVSWLLGLELLGSDERIRGDRRFLERLYRSIHQHGRFVSLRARLKKLNGRDGTNHQVASLSGLLFIAVYCPFFVESERWRKFAIGELLRAAREQILTDGWDHEASTSYHLLVLECFFHCMVLCERAGIGEIDLLRETVRRMCDALLAGVKRCGHAPQIGDNDSGRFVVHRTRPVLDHGYMLGLASTWFRDPELKMEGVSATEEVFWLFGIPGLETWARMPSRARPPASVSFGQAGWHVIREGEVYCFVSCGPNGQGGIGGHAHNDKLSFELSIGDDDLVVDPGSFVYTSYPRLRNEYRATRFHNTFAAHDCEQNPLTKNLFHLEDRLEIVTSTLTRQEAQSVFSGEIRYRGVVHRRSIAVDTRKPSIRIRDRVVQASRAGGVLSLHLAPGVRCRDGHLVKASTGRRLAALEVEGGRVREETYFYSPEYGVRVEARVVVIEIPPGRDRATVETVIHGC